MRFTNNEQPPDQRKIEIEQRVRSLDWRNDPTLKKFGVQITPDMIALQGRILPSPRLTGGADMEGGNAFGPSSGKWDLRGYRLKTVSLSSYEANCRLPV